MIASVERPLPPASGLAMTDTGSITRWIDDLRRGDEAAAEQLWTVYFARMAAFAGQHLAAAGRGADHEDAALSAFKSFCLGARAGRFPQLCDRDNLWPLLLALTSHKCVDHVRRETRVKRGGRAVSTSEGLEMLTSREPTPELLTEVSEQLENLLQRLDHTGDLTLRTVALGKLEGETNEEIADRLGCTRRTIERKIRVIEQVWDRGEETAAEGSP